MTEGHTVKASFNIHPIAYLGGYVGFGFSVLAGIAAFFFYWPIAILLIVIGLLGFLFIEISRRAYKFILTDEGVMKQYKFMSVDKTYAEYRVIQDIQVKQSILERLHGAGKIHINTSGSIDQEIIFPGLPRCFEVEEAIRTQMRKRSRVDTDTQ